MKFTGKARALFLLATSGRLTRLKVLCAARPSTAAGKLGSVAAAMVGVRRRNWSSSSSTRRPRSEIMAIHIHASDLEGAAADVGADGDGAAAVDSGTNAAGADTDADSIDGGADGVFSDGNGATITAISKALATKEPPPPEPEPTGEEDTPAARFPSPAPLAAPAAPAAPAPLAAAAAVSQLPSTLTPTTALTFNIPLPPATPAIAAAAGAVEATSPGVATSAGGTVQAKRARKLSTEMRQLQAVEAVLSELPDSYQDDSTRRVLEKTRSDLAATAAVVAAPKMAPPFPDVAKEPPATILALVAAATAAAPSRPPADGDGGSSNVADACDDGVDGGVCDAKVADDDAVSSSSSSSSSLAKFDSFVSLFDATAVAVLAAAPTPAAPTVSTAMQRHAAQRAPDQPLLRGGGVAVPPEAVRMKVEEAASLVAAFDTAFALAAHKKQPHAQQATATVKVQRRPKRGAAKKQRDRIEDLESHRFSYAVGFMNKASWSTVLYSQKSEML